jgi:DNA-binding HxlR family transcriptional regulator
MTGAGGLHLVSRTVIDTGPVRVRYELTEHGAAMRPAITELTRWAELHLQPGQHQNLRG